MHPGLKPFVRKRLIWFGFDCRELGLNQEALNDFFADKAHLALNDGAMFGKEGTGYMRLNVASPRSVIEQAMKQLAEAYQAMSFLEIKKGVSKLNRSIKSSTVGAGVCLPLPMTTTLGVIHKSKLFSGERTSPY